MTIINVNSISGINSITAQGASGIEFYDSSGNSVQTVTGDGLTVGTGATISGSTNTITASTNGSERLRIKSDGDTSLSYNLLIPEDKKIHFEGSSADDYNAIWKADTENTVFVTSRYNIANIIDSNNDDTSSFWSVRHNATTLADSGELMRVQSDGKVGIKTTNPDERLEVGDGTVSGGLKVSGQSSGVTSDGFTVDWESSTDSTRFFSEPQSGGSSQFKIYTTNSGTRSLAATINSSGNLVFPDGQGIDFSAVTSTAGGVTVGNCVLDDYEEGTFTPTLTYATPGTSSFSYTSQTAGYYTKIGRYVHLRIEIRLSSASKGTASGDLQVDGFPFTPGNLGGFGQFVGNFASFQSPLPTGAGQFPVFIAYLNQNKGAFKVIENNANWSVFPDPDNNSQYKLEVCYFV